MILNYKFEVYPTEAQATKLATAIALCRQAYNSALLDKGNHYKKHKKHLSKIGHIRINVHRKMEGKIKQVTIKRQGNRWFAIFSVEKPVKQHPSLEGAAILFIRNPIKNLLI